MTTPTGILFYQPQAQPLSAAGQLQGAAYAYFYVTGTLSATDVYSDATLATPISQPVTANSAGTFPIVYMDPAVLYRVKLFTAAGSLISDTDPVVVPGSVVSYPVSAAETAAGVTVNTVNMRYPYGNVLRYGLVPNDPGSASSNTSILQTLLNPLILNGPTGLVYFPNTGGASGAPDTYYFNGLIQVRDGVVLDLNGCTLSLTMTPVNADDNNGFLFLMRKVTVRNGVIDFTFLNGNSTATLSAICMGGRDAPVSGSSLPTIFDSLLAPFVADGTTMGQIVLENLRINGTTADSGEACGIFSLGGVNDVRIENVEIEGNSTLAFGTYYEFGWATSGSTNQRQTSHAHNWRISNYTVTNLVSGTTHAAFASNGGYNFIFDNVHASGCPGVIACSTGESMFFNPWVGVDDIGSLAQNGESPLTGTAAAGRHVTMRNITGRAVADTAITVTGATWPSGFGANVQSWLPNTAYNTNDIVSNGAFSYKCTAGGTSASTAGFAGPVGTSGAISDGSATWAYQSYAGATGFRGWQAGVAYAVNDVIINGTYIYICTTAGTAAANSQGPTGVGTGLSDHGGAGGATWSSVPSSSATAAPANSAWPASSDQLNMILDGFDLDSGTTGALSGGYGINSNCGLTSIRNGKITNFSRGVVVGGDCTQFVMDTVTCLNAGGTFAVQIPGPTSSVWSPERFINGAIKNCFIAGTSAAGAAGGYAIIIARCNSFLIENNRLGYELIHDGIAETTQENGVYVNVYSGASPANGVVCRNNYVNCYAGGYAYYQYSTTASNSNVIDNMLGPTQTYSGAWEGVEHTWTPVLTCATVGDLSVSYTTQAGGYVKRNHCINYWYNIVTSAFTHTTASGSVRVTGLPYVSSTVSNKTQMGPVAASGVTKANYTQVVGEVASATQYLTYSAFGSAEAASALAITDMPTSGSVVLQGSGEYTV